MEQFGNNKSEIQSAVLETSLEKRQRLFNEMNAFLVEEKFFDEKGKQVQIENVYWPTPEEEKEAEDLKTKLKDTEIGMFMSEIVDYAEWATIVDSIKSPEEDATTRRSIEGLLAKRAHDTTLSEDQQKFYTDLSNFYYHNRLRRGRIQSIVSMQPVLKEHFENFICSDETIALTKSIEPALQTHKPASHRFGRRLLLPDRLYMNKGNRKMAKMYDHLSDDGKISISKQAAQLSLSLAKDAVDCSRRNNHYSQ